MPRRPKSPDRCFPGCGARPGESGRVEGGRGFLAAAGNSVVDEKAFATGE